MAQSTQTSALPSYAESATKYKKLMDQGIRDKVHHKAPCIICGHNGPNFFQPEHHDCMKYEKELQNDTE